jgi:hypothetical protein
MEHKKTNPNIQYIFIDESGDLGKDGSNFFTITAIASYDPVPFKRIMKKARQKYLKKKLKDSNEIKANNSNERIRKYILQSVGMCHCAISAIVIPKSKIRPYLFSKKEKLYNYLCGLLFSHITLDTDLVKIVIDKKHTNRLLRNDLNQYILSKIKNKSNSINVEIRHLESHNSEGLHIVDFVAWAVNRNYSYKDGTYYDLIKMKIRNLGKEQIWK